MAVTLTSGLSGYVFGAPAQTGLGIDSLSVKSTNKKEVALNADGEIKGKAFYDAMRTITIKGEQVGSAGILTAVPGTTMTGLINGLPSIGGATTGGIYCESLDITLARGKWSEVSAEAEQNPNIP